MRAYLEDGKIYLGADNRKEVAYLAALYRREHLHFSCKAFLPNARGTKAGLALAFSVIRWQRPKRKPR